MFNKSKLLRSLLILCVTLAVALPALADTIKLKDGSIIKGRIITFGEGRFTILIGSGSRQRQMTFYADEVDTIEFDGVGPTAPRAPVTSYSDPAVTRTGGNTVITAGQNNSAMPVPTPVPTPAATPKPTPTQTQPQPVNNASRGAIINVKVMADNTSNGWTTSGYVVKKGQRIRVTATGRVSLGKNGMASPAGIAALIDRDKLMQEQATGSLIAVIGDDNNDFIFIGSSKDFVAQRDGILFLGVNEGNLDDNSGAFDVTIELDPSK